MRRMIDHLIGPAATTWIVPAGTDGYGSPGLEDGGHRLVTLAPSGSGVLRLAQAGGAVANLNSAVGGREGDEATTTLHVLAQIWRVSCKKLVGIVRRGRLM